MDAVPACSSRTNTGYWMKSFLMVTRSEVHSSLLSFCTTTLKEALSQNRHQAVITYKTQVSSKVSRKEDYGIPSVKGIYHMITSNKSQVRLTMINKKNVMRVTVSHVNCLFYGARDLSQGLAHRQVFLPLSYSPSLRVMEIKH